MLKGIQATVGEEDGACSSLLAGEGLAALQLPSSEPVVQFDLGYHFILFVLHLKISKKPRKSSFYHLCSSENCINASYTCINANFSSVKCSQPGPKYKQNIGILSLFSTTFETQYLIINGCWSSSTVELVCFPQRLELCRVTFHFGT